VPACTGPTDHPFCLDVFANIQLDEYPVAGRVGENFDGLLVALQRGLFSLAGRLQFGFDRVPMNDQSLVKVVGRRIDCLACYIDGLEPFLRTLRSETYRPDELRRSPCENLGRKHVGKREPLRLVGAEIVESNVEGVASRVFCPDWEEVIPRPHLNQRGQVFPTVFLA
jgi:hypothetical protein